MFGDNRSSRFRCVSFGWRTFLFSGELKAMMFFAREPHNVEQFKNMYNDETWRSMYKYIYYIRLEEKEIKDCFDCLKKYEKVGLSYFFYMMDTDEYRREMVGFTNFALDYAEDKILLDLSILDEKSINGCFSQIFKEEGYFLVSDNMFKKGSFEEIEYENTIIKTVKDENKTQMEQSFLRLL